MAVRIKNIRKARNEEWDSIWKDCPYATYFHSREWAEVWSAYTNTRSIPEPWLVMFEDGAQALFTLSFERSGPGLLGGYISSPAGNFGGWISRDDLSLAHSQMLADVLIKKFRVVFWRINPYDKNSSDLDIKGLCPDVTHTIDLSGGFENICNNWSHAHLSSVRKAQRAGVESRLAQTLDDWREYYLVYQDSLRRWGDNATSNYGSGLFKIFFDCKSSSIKLWLAIYEGKVISGSICFYAREHVDFWHGATLEQYFSLRPVNLLVYEIVKDACNSGYRWFDLNPSGGHQGVVTFKQRLGTQKLPASYIKRRAALGKKLYATKNNLFRAEGQKGHVEKITKAIIYPSSTVAGYGFIYSLGQEGIHVVALSDSPCANFRSKYVKERYVVPNPIKQHEEFVKWLIAYGKKQDSKAVLFMAEDLYAYIVSLYKEELSPFYFYPFIDKDKLNVFFNKREMFQAAMKAGLHQPRTLFAPLSEEDIQSWKNFPALMKPNVSRFTFHGRTLVDAVKFPSVFGGKAVQVNNESEIRALAARLKEMDIDYCIQELIPGENFNITNVKFVSGKGGTVPACFISRKIRQQPADFGTCSVSRADFIPELDKMTKDFCAVTGYAGPGGMEFKYNSNDGKWYFIEINPRLDFWIRMAVLKGINLPFQQYLLSTGQKLFEARQKDGGRLWIDIQGDMDGCEWRRKRPEWRLSWAEVLRPYLFFNEAIFNFADPLPGLIRLIHVVVGRLKKIVLRKGAGNAKGDL